MNLMKSNLFYFLFFLMKSNLFFSFVDTELLESYLRVSCCQIEAPGFTLIYSSSKSFIAFNI